jgi:FAD/FMN-containing dehydrogenase
VKEAGRELMETCVRAGGSISGEHGVGLDKREFLPLIFSEDDMDAMLRVRAAFDPLGIMNPGKIIPVLRGCGEGRAVANLKDNGTKHSDAPLLGPLASRPPLVQGNGHPEIAKTPGESVPANGSPVSIPGRLVDTASATLKLAPIVGHQHVSLARAFTTAGSLTPLSSLGDGAFSVTPGSADEVCEIIQLAGAEPWQITPTGAGTWLSPRSTDDSTIRLSTSRLNRIIEHEPADLIATAQAGVTLSEFNNELGKRGQWLPLDPPDDGRATLGGIVATGMAGAQKCGYGPPRAYVIGMRVALANGRVIKAGGRVVKNVAGYDLCKLFTGSNGALGVIVEVTFKVRPRPLHEATVIASASIESLFEGARAILDQRLFPMALEVLSPAMAREIDIETDQCLLLTRFAGNEQGVTFQSEQAAMILRAQSTTSDVARIAEDQFIWQNLAAVPLKFKDRSSLRAGVLPATLLKLIESIEQQNTLPWQAGIADGRLRLIGADSLQTASFKGMIAATKTLGGSLAVENPPIDLAQTIRRSHDSPQRDDLAKRIKHELDPRGVFAPGRIFEG